MVTCLVIHFSYERAFHFPEVMLALSWSPLRGVAAIHIH